MVEEDRTLESIELRGVGCDLSQKRIGHQHDGLVRVARVGVAQQGRHIHVEGLCEAIERGERRHGLCVLDLRNISARHIHAGGELPLREIADVPQFAYGGCYLNSLGGLCECRNKCQWGYGDRQSLDLKTALTAPAFSGLGAKLDELAMVALQNFAFVVHDLAYSQGGYRSCHKLCIAEAVPERVPQRECPIMVHLRCSKSDTGYRMSQGDAR